MITSRECRERTPNEYWYSRWLRFQKLPAEASDPKVAFEDAEQGAVIRLAGSPPIMEASHGNSGTRLPGYWNNQD
jgi:hypothetical protein